MSDAEQLSQNHRAVDESYLAERAENRLLKARIEVLTQDLLSEYRLRLIDGHAHINEQLALKAERDEARAKLEAAESVILALEKCAAAASGPWSDPK